MKVTLLFASLFLATGCSSSHANAQLQDQSYQVAVAFNSICCGTASDDFLKTFVQKFNSANKVKIVADIVAGCGREGEYVVLFRSDKLKTATGKKFVADLEKLVPQQEEKNRKLDKSSGGIEVLHNVKVSDYAHCRIKLQKWNY